MTGYANHIQAQDSIVYKVPNLNKFTTKAKSVVSFVSKPFSFLQKDTTRKYSKKDVIKKPTNNKVKKPKQLTKIINTGSYNPIKIRLPKLKPIHFSFSEEMVYLQRHVAVPTDCSNRNQSHRYKEPHLDEQQLLLDRHATPSDH